DGLDRALQREHHPGEQRGEHDDRPGLHAEEIGLVERLADADAQRDDEAQRVAEQLGDPAREGEDVDGPPPHIVEDLHSGRSSATASRTPRTASSRLTTTPRSAVRLYWSR